MPSWTIKLVDDSYEEITAERLFITQSGGLVFSKVEGKQFIPIVSLAAGEWKRVVRSDEQKTSSPPL